MKFDDFVCRESVNANLQAAEKEGVIREMAQALVDAEKIVALAQEQLVISELHIGDIGSAIASFGGPGAIGIAGYPANLA